MCTRAVSLPSDTRCAWHCQRYSRCLHDACAAPCANPCPKRACQCLRHVAGWVQPTYSAAASASLEGKPVVVVRAWLLLLVFTLWRTMGAHTLATQSRASATARKKRARDKVAHNRFVAPTGALGAAAASTLVATATGLTGAPPPPVVPPLPKPSLIAEGSGVSSAPGQLAVVDDSVVGLAKWLRSTGGWPAMPELPQHRRTTRQKQGNGTGAGAGAGVGGAKSGTHNKKITANGHGGQTKKAKKQKQQQKQKKRQRRS